MQEGMGQGSSVKDETVSTGVDALVRLLDKKPMISMDDAAKTLQVKLAVIQNWVDFLVEEKIIGIEYQFITPYLFLIRDKKEKLQSKEEFFTKAKAKKIDIKRAHVLWTDYYGQHKSEFRSEFFAKAQSRGLGEDKIELLWYRFEQVLLEEPK